MNTAAKKIVAGMVPALAAVDPDAAEELRAAMCADKRETKKENDSLLMNQASVARALNCSRWTVRNLSRDGTLKQVSIRGLARYRRADVLRLAGSDAQ